MKIIESGLFQIRQLRMLDFAVDLCERFLAAHRQNRMSQADKNRNQRNHVRPLITVEPAERALVEFHVGGTRRTAADASPAGRSRV